jgi:hypothetical protein
MDIHFYISNFDSGFAYLVPTNLINVNIKYGQPCLNSLLIVFKSDNLF